MKNISHFTVGHYQDFGDLPPLRHIKILYATSIRQLHAWFIYPLRYNASYLCPRRK